MTYVFATKQKSKFRMRDSATSLHLQINYSLCLLHADEYSLFGGPNPQLFQMPLNCQLCNLPTLLFAVNANVIRKYCKLSSDGLWVYLKYNIADKAESQRTPDNIGLYSGTAPSILTLNDL